MQLVGYEIVTLFCTATDSEAHNCFAAVPQDSDVMPATPLNLSFQFLADVQRVLFV